MASPTSPTPTTCATRRASSSCPYCKRPAREIVAFDPEGARSAEALLPGVEFASGPYACLEGADALVVITEWDAFRALDLARVKAAMREPVVVDLRNIYPQGGDAGDGFRYEGVGRGAGG